MTYALLSPSPAIDAGDPVTCLATDQRGVVRPLDGDGNSVAVCDIGAFEAPLPPEIEVLGNNIPIVNGDTTPSPADQTDFGVVPAAGGAVTHTFTISNTGVTDLLLTGSPAVMIGGPAASHFSLTASPATPVAPGSATTFRVTFEPAAAGLLTATLTIANNDPDEATYSFVIQGISCFNAITVSNAGDGGPGTLRQALAEVCDGGVIDFAGSLANQTISLTSAELAISKTVTITNPNAPGLAISGNNARRVFEIQAGGVVTLSYLSVISGTTSGDGGGIFNGGVLTLNHSTLNGNSASLGGGILNNGVLTLNNSTLSGNSAGLGGGIYNVGTLTLNNSTLSGNSASFGGGLYNNATLHLRNTLVANSLSGGDCSTVGPLATNVNNLIEDNSCSPALDDDPNLGPLQDNGGPTLTHALLFPSPAIDTGDAETCLAVDQRGISRPLDGNGDGLAICDIGAYEVAVTYELSLSKTVNQTHPEPGQIFTYTIAVQNNSPVNLGGGLISDTLPAGLNLAGPVMLEPPGSGMVGSFPTLASSLTLTAGQTVTVTFPVTISDSLAGGTVITNVAAASSAAVMTPVTASVSIIITGSSIKVYLPVILK